MPAQTIDKLRETESTIRQQLAKAGDDLPAERRRELQKALRRTQRKRRRMDASTAKHAPKPSGESAEG